MRALVLIAGLVGQGCAYRVALQSQPEPVLVELPDGSRVSTSDVAQLKWAPFNHQRVRVTATGYRPLEIDLRARDIRLRRLLGRPFKRVKGEVEFILVPTHGPSGTWSEADVRQ